MKVVVKNPFRDTLSFILHLKKRDRLFKKAAISVGSSVDRPAGTTGQGPAPMNLLAARLHPRGQLLRIREVRQETPTTRTYRLEPAETDTAADPPAGTGVTQAGASPEEGRTPAFFRAGQYIAVEEEVDGIPVSRPFSISSTPDEALKGRYYEITVKTGDSPDGPGEEKSAGADGGTGTGGENSPGRGSGFFAPWSAREWKTGRVLQCSEPMGTFYYEPLRDAGHLVCLAGGSGITPFRSILKDNLEHEPEVRCTLFYGVTAPEELAFGEELTELEAKYPGKLTVIPVFSGPPAAHAALSGPGIKKTETGFITAELIRKYVPAPEEASFFLCGPPGMYDFLKGELEAFSLPPKRLRREVYGRPDNVSVEGRTYTLTVYMNGQTGIAGDGRESLTIQAADSETVLTALERAGLNPPALCRSGECGWCRSRLISGEIHVSAENDGRRKADLKFRWFHPCSSYPRSDLTIEVPRNPLKRR